MSITSAAVDRAQIIQRNSKWSMTSDPIGSGNNRLDGTTMTVAYYGIGTAARLNRAVVNYNIYLDGVACTVP
jgi:hypothetical protein